MIDFEGNVSEVIDTSLKRAATALSESLDYDHAAETLGISTSELRRQIIDLESRLCLRIFEPERSSPELTNEGRFLIGEFRKALARIDG